MVINGVVEESIIMFPRNLDYTLAESFFEYLAKALKCRIKYTLHSSYDVVDCNFGPNASFFSVEGRVEPESCNIPFLYFRSIDYFVFSEDFGGAPHFAGIRFSLSSQLPKKHREEISDLLSRAGEYAGNFFIDK